MENWKTKQLASTYLEGVRGAIPLANDQIEILIRIIHFFKPDVKSFLDLGCGDGILGYTLFSRWPQAKGIFVDYSKPMLNAAKARCSQYQMQSRFIVQDFGKNGWIKSIGGYVPVDVVVSGFSIHHQDDERKKRLYAEIFEQILKPGGVFLDLDQVASPNKNIERIFDQYFLDKMKAFQLKFPSDISIEKITEEYYKDKEVNKLTYVENQCIWLENIGFKNVDCFFKAFELAVFGGVKPG